MKLCMAPPFFKRNQVCKSGPLPACAPPPSCAALDSNEVQRADGQINQKASWNASTVHPGELICDNVRCSLLPHRNLHGRLYSCTWWATGCDVCATIVGCAQGARHDAYGEDHAWFYTIIHRASGWTRTAKYLFACMPCPGGSSRPPSSVYAARLGGKER